MIDRIGAFRFGRLAICLSFVMLAACSSQPTRPQQDGALSVLPAAPSTDIGSIQSRAGASGQPTGIYVSNTQSSIVNVFTPDGHFKRTITSGISSPTGLFIDGNQNLWVANQSDVTMYPNGQSSPARTLSDPGGSPVDIDVTTDGTVYVTNFSSHSVSIYAKGSDTPTRTLTDPNAQYLVGVAVDASGDVFVTSNDSTNVGYLAEFSQGRQAGYKKLPPRFAWASDIKLDLKGNLLILDSQTYRIREFTTAGRLTGLSFFTFNWWNAFDINADDTYVAGTQALPDIDNAVLKTFPAGKTVAKFFKGLANGIYGVALAPGHF